MLSRIFVLTLCISCCLCNKFQSAKIPQCVAGDLDCIKDVVNFVIQRYHGGEPKIGLSSFDPLKIQTMLIKQGGKSPVNVEINFSNVELVGLGNFVCTSVSGFGPDPNGHYEIRLNGPQFILRGPYEMRGKILVLPVLGQGNTTFTLDNPQMIVRFTGQSRVKNGKTHLYTDDMRMTFKITKMQAHFENLFNGDKALGETTNRFLNEEWQTIFNEIKGSIFDAFSLITQAQLNNMWSHHDYSQMFKQ